MIKCDLIADNVRAVADAFRCGGNCQSAEPCGSGHINDTYKVRFIDQANARHYILQRINSTVFKNIPAMMDNISRVTIHQREKLLKAGASDLNRRTLNLVPAKDGNNFHVDNNGAFWRTYLFIEGTRAYDTADDPGLAYEAAKAFGEFQLQLSDLPGRLHDTIPNFHNARMRFNALKKAIAGDPCGRAASVRREIEFVLAREDMVDVVVDLMAGGAIPERVTHNDTKLNNVLIDDATGKGLCVIDLDVVMSGTVLYDFGDMVRTAAATAVEDEVDQSKVEMDIRLFDAIAQGYFESAAGFLVPREREYLPFAGTLITFIMGMRFLADYLQGDVYYRSQREGHNLDRCRTQFKLVESMEKQMDAMRRIVDGY